MSMCLHFLALKAWDATLIVTWMSMQKGVRAGEA